MDATRYSIYPLYLIKNVIDLLRVALSYLRPLIAKIYGFGFLLLVW
jgi:hypothetical protein